MALSQSKPLTDSPIERFPPSMVLEMKEEYLLISGMKVRTRLKTIFNDFIKHTLYQLTAVQPVFNPNSQFNPKLELYFQL